MRYNIFCCNQERAIEMGISLEGCLIIDWFMRFKDGEGMKTKVIDNDLGYWVSYKHMMEELPIIFGIAPDETEQEAYDKWYGAARKKAQRLVKNMLSKVFTAHSFKYSTGTEIYFVLNRKAVSYLTLGNSVKNGNKKGATVAAATPKYIGHKEHLSDDLNKPNTILAESLTEVNEINELLEKYCISVKKEDISKLVDIYKNTPKSLFEHALGVTFKKGNNGIMAIKREIINLQQKAAKPVLRDEVKDSKPLNKKAAYVGGSRRELL